ncbi:MAG: VOC family protein [Microgenomates group bacterium]
MTKITPFLWFDKEAGEAAKYYVSIFPGGKTLNSNPMFTTFEIAGQTIMALNGGPEYKHSPAFSFFVDCEDQAEVDLYWDKLMSDGGSDPQCGWLKDKYGLSWQIIPKQLGDLLSDPDPAKSGRVMATMRQMKKIIVADLIKAAKNLS